MIRFASSVSCILLFALVGCQQGTQYGGYPVQTTLDSKPPGAPAYLIDYGDWSKAGGLAALQQPQLIESHMVGTTPLTRPLRKKRYVYVVRMNGQYQFKEIIPSDQDDHFTIP